MLDAVSNGAQVTLRIPSTGFSRVFTGTTASDVEDQIEDFLKSDGAKAFAQFLEEVNGRSPLAVIDGALTLAGDFNPGVGLSFSVLGQYRDYDGSDVFDLGFGLGVPVHIFAATQSKPIRWTVTPYRAGGRRSGHRSGRRRADGGRRRRELGVLHLRAGWESDLGDDYEAHLGKGEIRFEF